MIDFDIPAELAALRDEFRYVLVEAEHAGERLWNDP